MAVRCWLPACMAWLLLLALSDTRAAVTPVPVNVTGQVTVSSTKPVYNNVTRTYDATASVTNNFWRLSSQLRLLVRVPTPGVTLSNATAVDSATGLPYRAVSLSAGGLGPASSVRNIALKFHNPARVAFTYSVLVYAHVDTGASSTTSVLQFVSSAGGTLRLPSVATLQIPPNAMRDSLVELSTGRLPVIDELLPQSHPAISLLPAPRIQVKSTAPFKGALLLTLHNLTSLPTALVGGGWAELAVPVRGQGGDSFETAEMLTLAGGHPCGDKGTEFCAELHAHAFEAVPSDPEDPVQIFALVKFQPRTEMQQAATLDAYIDAQAAPVGLPAEPGPELLGSISDKYPTSRMLFSEDPANVGGINFMGTINFGTLVVTPPLPSLTTTSPFMVSRFINNALTPHYAQDLRALVPTPVTPMLRGTLDTRRTGYKINLQGTGVSARLRTYALAVGATRAASSLPTDTQFQRMTANLTPSERSAWITTCGRVPAAREHVRTCVRRFTLACSNGSYMFRGTGNRTWVQHTFQGRGTQLYSGYAHLGQTSTPTVDAQGFVTSAGTTGLTGTCDPHLHMMVEFAGRLIDPRPFLDGLMGRFMLPAVQSDQSRFQATVRVAAYSASFNGETGVVRDTGRVLNQNLLSAPGSQAEVPACRSYLGGAPDLSACGTQKLRLETDGPVDLNALLDRLGVNATHLVPQICTPRFGPAVCVDLVDARTEVGWFVIRGNPRVLDQAFQR